MTVQDNTSEGLICDSRSFDWVLSDHEVDVVQRRESITGRELYEAVYIEGVRRPWDALSPASRKFYAQRAKALSSDPGVRRQVEKLNPAVKRASLYQNETRRREADDDAQ